MRQTGRWLRNPRHGVWLALVGIFLPRLAMRVLRARGGHTIGQQPLASPGVARVGARRLQAAGHGTNGAGGL
jgi:hypothetical protein